MNRVKGKVAIITGGAGGIGRAASLLLAEEGANVVVTDTDEIKGNEVAAKIRGVGGEAIFIKHDVTKELDWDEVMKKTLAKFHKLDILVNNAGIFLVKKIEDTSLDEWRRVMNVNSDGVFLGTKRAMQEMKKTGGGAIINISSINGMVGVLNTSAYSVSKGAVRIFTKAAAFECSKAGYDYNIRVNSIHPGIIETPMVADKFKDETIKKSREAWHLMGHFGKPEDIANGILYLASDESRFVTGAELVIDGGLTAH